MNNILDYKFEELSTEPCMKDEKKFRSKQVYEWLHKKLVSKFDYMTNIPKDLIFKLKNRYYIGGISCSIHRVSKIDETEKFLFTLHDNNQIESVLMKYKHGNTVCISTQVGCRMGCKFCASTLDGLARNLTPGEMLSQVYEIIKMGNKVSNVVLMGQGEPLDNYDNVLKFLHMITDDKGLNISRRNVTISTCGIVPNIYKLADDNVTSTLAISLHAPYDSLRQQMMPIGYRYSIDEIIKSVDYYIKKTSRRVSFEYALVSGVNDSMECAEKLVNLLRGKLCHINLIPVNEIKERDFNKPNEKNIKQFFKYIEKNNINVTIRKEMGSDISGACGQLRRSVKEE